MKRTTPCSVLILTAVWLCHNLSSTFAVTEFDDIVISPEFTPRGSSFHGYAEFRINVSNRSPDKAHRVELTLPKSSMFGNNMRRITRSVIVGPSATALVTLFQPPVRLDGRDLEVAIDGKVQDEAVTLSMGNHGPQNTVPTAHVAIGTMPSARSSNPEIRILISRSVDTVNLHTHVGRQFNTLRSSSGVRHPSTSGSSGAGYETIDLGLPVSAWSSSWLGYSRYDGVVVTGDDVRRMPPDVQSALWKYVQCGGTLLVLGGRELPNSWELNPTDDTTEFVTYYAGFGQCTVTADVDTNHLTREQWSEVVFSWLKTKIHAKSGRSVEVANTMFPVVKGLEVPVRGLYLLMLLFAVTIGPVNLMALSRKKHRIWMLWTAPAISLMTCLAVFAYATLAEGWDRHARIEGLTILNEKTHSATTIGWTAFYSALTPSDGLHFGYDTELTPQIASSQMGGTPRSVDWTHDQHLESGWMTARIPAHFMLRKSEVRRERVTLRREAKNRLSIVNGLGVYIREFWLADKDGAIYSAEDIPPGVETELSLRTELRLGRPGAIDKTFHFELWDASVNMDLDAGNISPALRAEMQWHGEPLSDDVSLSVSKPGYEWMITDRLLNRVYTIKTGNINGALRIHSDAEPNLRGIFASDDWIQNINNLKETPENFLRANCYIAELSSAPFIEEGLRNTTEKRYSSVVYGILDEE